MEQPADDYDTPWKTAVMRYFREFMAFFFPLAHDGIDWSKEYSFLDQELAQIARDARLGRRRLDKLVRVTAMEGDARLLYIHIEIQRCREKHFAERLFTYHYRLYDRFNSPIATLVILADPHPGWRPDTFSYEVFGCKINMQFPAVKLMDYWPALDQLLGDENPFALLTAAHLITLHTRGDEQRRFAFKCRLTELMYARGWDQQRILDLFDVLDWMMTIPDYLQHQLQGQIADLVRRKEMPFENLMIKMFKEQAREEGRDLGLEEGRHEGLKEGLKEGREEGREKGRKEGREEGREVGLEEGREEGREEGQLAGRRALVQKLLKIRFGGLPADLAARVAQAGTSDLEAWEDKILLAVTLDELFNGD
jgi:hypothetical protein